MSTTQSATTTPQASNSMLTISRWIVGILFIFSGLIKANDPSGLAFKMTDFFRLWGTTFLIDYAMFLSVVMIAFEIIAGAAVLIGYKFRTFSFLLLVLIIFFTFLTGYAVIYELSTGNELKCGCFGDCIPLSAWQSFVKDLILLALVIFIFKKRHSINSALSSKMSHILMLIVTIISFAIQFWTIRFLPFVDCLPFKEGRNMNQFYHEAIKLNDSTETTFVYEINGKKEKVSYDKYMEDSTYWEMTPVETITEIVKKAPTYAESMRAFKITDEQGQEYQEAIFESADAYFIFLIRDVSDMNKANIEKVKKIYDDLNVDKKAGIVAVTNSPLIQVQKMLSENGMPEMQVFILNDVSIKTAIRSNPGLILIQNGVIKGKWTPYNYPSGFTFDGNELKVN